MRRNSFISPNIIGQGVFYSPLLKPTTVLHIQPSEKIDLLEARLAYLIVPRYYLDRRDTGFMKNLTCKGKVFSDRSNHANKHLCELDRVLYIYVSTILRTTVLSGSEINWNFPDKYSKTLGLSVRGFSFTFPDLSGSLKTLFEPSQDLLNKETGTEEISSVSTQYSFFPEQKPIEDAIKKLNEVSVKYFINESYFLYDKSDLIKETFVTSIQKKISIYGSISYFSTKTENEIFKIVSPEEYLKFFVDKDKNKNSLSFQLTDISGKISKLKDKKVHNFSLTRIGQKRKRKMTEPIETAITCAQQSFEIAGGLNTVQIELEDDRVLNIF